MALLVKVTELGSMSAAARALEYAVDYREP